MPLWSGPLQVVGYLLAINAVAFGAFAWDKHCAREAYRRVPERRLIWLALIGGSIGAFAGQQILRHKTTKQPFRTQLAAVIGLQTVVLAGWIFATFRAAG